MIKQLEIKIREAQWSDREFVITIMDSALRPYYGGDHRAHAERIFSTHISGGKDHLGFFSNEQKMFILTVDENPAGMIHLVGKRQGTYKISPLIVDPQFQGNKGLGSKLLSFAEQYARDHNARQIYCTVAEQNHSALNFFLKKAYIVAGASDSHYKSGVTETMLYKQFLDSNDAGAFDRPNISVLSCDERHEDQVRALLLAKLPATFHGINEEWVDSLFKGYKRKDTKDINQKYKMIFVALDRNDTVLGIAGATPKKGEPIKVMPFIATSLPAFVALLTDIPYLLRDYGRKLYIHITPTPAETYALQQRRWRLDASLPAAYHEAYVTQQWSTDIDRPDFMRIMRVKQVYLDLIKQGKKTLEVRVGYPTIRSIHPGEKIRLSSRDQEQIIRVNDVRRYPSFEAMLGLEDSSQIAPGNDPSQVMAILKEIYPPDRETLGVIVLDISPEK